MIKVEEINNWILNQRQPDYRQRGVINSTENIGEVGCDPKSSTVSPHYSVF